MSHKIPWDIADLIVAQWQGELTDAQQQQLNAWLEASDRHKMLYEKVQKQENFQRYASHARQHRYEKKYEEFCRHISRSRHRRRIRRMQYAAAVLLPLAMLGGWWWQQQGVEPATVEQIVPGQYQALLTLPGGEIVRLEKGKPREELDRTNVYFNNDTLSYRADETTTEAMHTLTIPRGGEYMLRLADGTEVWLNAESELRYPPVFRGQERRVYLEGEAYFAVAHDSLHPFIVQTGEQRLTVLGTSFGLRAYKDEGQILTTLETGSVQVEAGPSQVKLFPGEQARYEHGKLKVQQVNTSLYTAWHKGQFIFHDQPLEEILHTLARWYNITVVYQNPEVKSMRFNGELPRYGEIRELLDKIELLHKVRFDIRAKTVNVLMYE